MADDNASVDRLSAVAISGPSVASVYRLSEIAITANPAVLNRVSAVAVTDPTVATLHRVSQVMITVAIPKPTRRRGCYIA